MDVGRKTDKADHQTLSLCAQHLRRLGALTHAAEMYKYVAVLLSLIAFTDGGWSLLIDQFRMFYDEVCEKFNVAFILFRKMGEMQSVVELYVEVQDWEEAFLWADKHPEYRQLVYVPYATSLAEQDKFLQAQKGMGFIIF